MILKMYMCNQFHFEITLQYNKVIMPKKLQKCVFKYFLITIYIIIWGGDWMVNFFLLGCNHGFSVWLCFKFVLNSIPNKWNYYYLLT
jgi:hypothetical protein